MDYDKLSDFEINKYVLLAIGGKMWNVQSPTNDIGTVNREVDGCCQSFNPCNNAEDAWEIIIEYRIALIPLRFWDGNEYDDSALWRAEAEHYIVEHTNPLRAAMCVFLALKEDYIGQ